MLWGFVKKLVIADNCATVVNDHWGLYAELPGLTLFLLGVLFTFQIYCDFSGYSDIAIGCARLFGFNLMRNFNFPYFSRSIPEFWRRWHISLTTWFRDYVYIPLGGNRKGNKRTYFNNFVTMLVAGLWHGSSWMFVIWGALHGIGCVIHKYCKRWLDPIPKYWYVRFISWLITFCYVALAWTFFRAPNVSTATTILSHIASDFSLAYLVPFVETRMTWTIFVVLGFGLHAVRQRHVDRLRQLYIDSPWTLKLILLFVVLQVVINYRLSDIQPFIYAQF
jgi:D-alanyl-lipoteichoic acid acyltransferase DltB (MBOAT superfamily)